MILEDLNCPFGGIHAMIVGLDELKFYVFFIEKCFDRMGGHIIHDVELWAKTSIFEIFDFLGEGFDDGIIGSA